MAITFAIFFLFKSRGYKQDRSSTQEPASPFKSSTDTYSELLEKTQMYRKQVLQNNRLYLGSLVVSYGAERIGTMSGNPLLGNTYVIASVYLCAFLVCLQALVKGKKLDKQIISHTIKGIELETPSTSGYFHDLSMNYRGWGMLMLIFMRLALPMWILYCGLDPVTKLSTDFLSQGQSQSMLGVALILIAALLWRIICYPYTSLTKMKGAEIT